MRKEGQIMTCTCPVCGDKTRLGKMVDFLISRGLLRDNLGDGERKFGLTDMCCQLFKKNANKIYEKLRQGDEEVSYINTCNKAIAVISVDTIVCTLKLNEPIEESTLIDASHVLSNMVRLVKDCANCPLEGREFHDKERIHA